MREYTPNAVGYRLLTDQELVKAYADLRAQNAEAMKIVEANGHVIHPRAAEMKARAIANGMKPSASVGKRA